MKFEETIQKHTLACKSFYFSEVKISRKNEQNERKVVISWLTEANKYTLHFSISSGNWIMMWSDARMKKKKKKTISKSKHNDLFPSPVIDKEKNLLYF